MSGQATTHPAADTTAAPARSAPAPAEVTGRTARHPVMSYQQDFPGRADQLSQLRREIAGYLGNCPAAADLVLIASELAANAIVHSRSRGSTFSIRCQLSARAARIEVEDTGGPWRQQRNPGDRPHGLDVVQVLTGPGQWGPRSPAPEDVSSGPGSHGEHQRTPAEARARASVMPRAKVAIVPGSYGGFNRIDELNDLIAAFIKAQSAGLRRPG